MSREEISLTGGIMRQPIQVLGVPYITINGTIKVIIFKRRNGAYWQFVSGGKERGESKRAAMKREIAEELSIKVEELIPLKTKTLIPSVVFGNRFKKRPLFVTEYCFAFQVVEPTNIVLSDEHSEMICVSYDEAMEMLKWDSNKTAMYELFYRMNLER